MVVEATYDPHPNQYLEILNLKFGGRSIVPRRFRFLLNCRGEDEIKDLPTSIDFPT